MVKIAVAGTGQVSGEVIDALVAAKKHEITILSRRDAPTTTIFKGVRWQKVDYSDKNDLVEALRGIHTVLSFIQTLSDPNQTSQKNLIDAAITAGVKRFAPSEYGSKDTVNMPWCDGKEAIRAYLQEVNANGPVLEYTLFQPGLFLDYLAFPHKTSTHLEPLQTVFDFDNQRAIVVAGQHDAIMTFTAVADVAAVVALAVDHDGPWPAMSGIRGNRLTVAQVIEIGERVRGSPFSTTALNPSDLESNILDAPWALQAIHSAVAHDPVLAEALLKTVTIGILLSSAKGAWDVGDEMNNLFPGYVFAGAESFLGRVWAGKA